MRKIANLALVSVLAVTISACGDKTDSSDTAAEAQKAIQEGIQKERAMMEGMKKGVENMEKKMTEQKEAASK